MKTASSQITQFMKFVQSHGVVGLAVGLAIGAQVGKTVEAIVVNFINPIVGFILGDTQGLEALSFTISAGSRAMTIGWGAIISSLITLLAVSAVVFYLVMGLKLDKDVKKK